MPAYTYIKDPKLIYAESFARVKASATFVGVTPEMVDVIVRLIHACGMPDVVKDLNYSSALVDQAVAALRSGCSIFCDCEMVAAGITLSLIHI